MSLSICGLVGGNTGAVNCDVAMGLPKALEVGGKVFQPADYASSTAFGTALVAATKLANGNASKLFPFPIIQGSADKSDANKEGTLGYGFKQILLEGRPAYEFQVLCGQTQFAKLRKWNRVIVPVGVLDDASNYWGVLNSDNTFNGFSGYIFVSGNSFGDGSKNIVATVTISFLDVAEFRDNAAFIPVAANLKLAGLNDVVLNVNAGGTASNVTHISGYVLTAKLGTKISMRALFGTAMATAANWVASTPAGPIAITSVADDAANDGWTFTLNSTAFTALTAGTVVTIGWADPTTLDAANVPGVENTVQVTIIR